MVAMEVHYLFHLWFLNIINTKISLDILKFSSKYLVDNDFDFGGLMKLRKNFKDLTEVRKAIGNF